MEVGQLVEIPRESSIYSRESPFFLSKEEELSWKINQRKYSLFDGFIVGGHNGIENFKIGQRKGLNISGKRFPVYVIGIDRKENRIFVGQGNDHLGLFTDVLLINKARLDWIEKIDIKEEIKVTIFLKELNKQWNVVFYQFGENYFIEFDEQVPLTIQNYKIEFFYENKKILELNK